MTAVADGLPGFRWCKRNEVVYIDLPEKMSLIMALIIRLIWGEKKQNQPEYNNDKQRTIEYTYAEIKSSIIITKL